jgi:hypothetical protein
MPVASIARALALVAAASAAATAATAQTATPASGFECAWAKAAQPLAAAGDPLDDIVRLNATVDSLRARGFTPTAIVDALISGYCPIVAARRDLSDAEKTARMRQFASQVTRLVFRANDQDSILIEVPLQPTVVDAARSKAAAAGVSLQDWIAQAVDGALRAKP